MTNAEKQEIIEAVLAALATNSKTIAQLSPKQSLIDSDLFEVAGGSRVNYLVLKNGIREGLALASQLSDYVTGEAAMMYLAKLDTETGTIDFKESPCVMLDGFKDVNGYSPATGDLFYENRSGYQIWTKTQGGATGEHANTHVAYINRNENAIYRWTGTTMERIGGCAVVNDLTTGGGDKALSAEMGKRLKENLEIVQDNIVRLFNNLDNIAFWNSRARASAIPNDLDWSTPKHSLTVNLSLSNAVVKYHGVEVSNGQVIANIQEGTSVILTVEATPGYTISSVSAPGATVSSDLSTVTVRMGTSDMSLTITASSALPQQITVTVNNAIGAGAIIKDGDGNVVNGSVNIYEGDPLTLTIEPSFGFSLSSVAATVGGVAQTVTESGGVYTLAIARINAATTIAITGTAVSAWTTANKSNEMDGETVVRYGMQQGRSIYATSGAVTSGMVSNNTVPAVILSPAGYPLDTFVFTTNKVMEGHTNTNPGKTENCFFPTGGKRYLNVRLVDAGGTTGYEYKVGVGCYGSEVIGNAQAEHFYAAGTSISGNKNRIDYSLPSETQQDGTMIWKIDLQAHASGIEYIKLLVCKYPQGETAGVDSRTWFDNMTLQYMFTDD